LNDISDIADRIAVSPALYPVQDQGAQIRLIQLSEADYRQASFLDERVIAVAGGEAFLSWEALERASAALTSRANFVFHIGHVGSTLMARLLGEHPDVFSLREPGLLRPVAGAWLQGLSQARGRVETLLRLFSRTWRPNQTALIKATSFVSEMAEDLLARDPEARALAMGVAPPSYLRGILGGQASRQEIAFMAPQRLARLRRRLGASIETVSEGETIAMSWLCETLALHAACERYGIRTLWVDFDRFLTEPAAGIGMAFAHLGVEAQRDFVEALAAGPLMRRYSKGPEHTYDADLRRQVQAQAEHEHGGEVRAGMDWLQRMANAHPPALAALRHAASAARAVAASSQAG
jgi:hypothetical protein